MKQIFWFVAIVILLFSCEKPNKKLPSGHPYYHLIDYEGYEPQEGDIVEYHFVQRNKDGVMYSTREEGVSKKIRIPKINAGEAKVVAPLTEAMMLMSEGDSLVLEVLSEFLPPQLDGRTDGESMFFDIEMIKITTAEDIEKEATATKKKGEDISRGMKELSKQYREGELKDLEDLEGIKYKIAKKGTGLKLKPDDKIIVHCSGHVLETGETYLETYSRNRPYLVVLGASRVIEAWEKVLPFCTQGDELYMFVPYEKAYGVAGSPGLGIPEKSDLAIYVEIYSMK